MEVAELLSAVDLEARTCASLANLSFGGRVVVIAIGKAAPAMARGALSALARAPDELLVVTTDGTDPRGLAVTRAAHPIPDRRSLEAGERALALAHSLGPRDVLLALVSGGASALACAPAPPLDLPGKQALTHALIRSGAPIDAINLVRRHASLLKGGGLLGVHRTITRVASDVLVQGGGAVIEGPASAVGSGPASRCPSTVAEARRVLDRWVKGASCALVEHDGAPEDERIVAGPLDLARGAADRLSAAGLSVTVMRPSLAPVEQLAGSLASRARSLARGAAEVQVVEPSVTLEGPTGQGGRAGRLALLSWQLGLPEDVTLACLPSDGVDGAGGGGARVSGRVPDPAGATAALAAYDDAPFLERHGALVPRGPTGQNLLDLVVLVRA